MFRVRSMLFRRYTHPLKSKSIPFTPIRNHGAVARYRTSGADPPRLVAIAAELFGGFMWWWILSKMYYDWEHFVGEFDYPDPTIWTDEELGITDYNEIAQITEVTDIEDENKGEESLAAQEGNEEGDTTNEAEKIEVVAEK